MKTITVQVILGEHLEYYMRVKNKKKSLTYSMLQKFLKRRLEEAPEYLAPYVLEGIQAVELLKSSEYGFPVLGKCIHGAGRHIMLNKKLFSMSFNTLDVYSLKGW